MNKSELIKKITQKKEFSQLLKKDVELAFEKFDKPHYVDEEKIKLTRNLLRQSFTAFMGRKILTPKDKDVKWFLNKHVSTKERLTYYEEVYSKVLKGFTKVSVIDLGAGINGISYEYFGKVGKQVNYVGIESVGQLVELTNRYFKKKKLNGKVIQKSLFELNKIKRLIKKQGKPRVCFLFKTVDSLEMLKRDYSKKLLLNIVPLVDRMVVSFAMRSLFKKQIFKVRREWAINFIRDKFEILEDFELGGERYISFKTK